jgi:ferrochelatase
MRRALLIVNLGTPESPDVRDVRPYLQEFLGDHRVIELPAPIRWMLVNLLIVPFRSRKSARAYESIWTSEGSPLKALTKRLAQKTASRSAGEFCHIDFAMRYGTPSMEQILHRWSQQKDIDEIVVFPLYPQFASSTWMSLIDALQAAHRNIKDCPKTLVASPYYADARFVKAFARSIQSTRQKDEHVLFSFHSIPTSHLRHTDAEQRCLKTPNCCEGIELRNHNCYRAHCMATARAIAADLGLDSSHYSVTFQSRLGRGDWLTPSTESFLVDFAKSHPLQDLVIASPSFPVDCLETLEELGMHGAETYRANGGGQLRLASCPNDDETWAQDLIKIALGASQHPALTLNRR